MMTRARSLKHKCLCTSQLELKEEYLPLFVEAEDLVSTEYAMLQSEEEGFACDIEIMKQQRRKNANYLIGKLSEISEELLYFKEVSDDDVPLFVPIRLPTDIRGAYRQYMMENDVYLPIHWPKTEGFVFDNSLYDEEISIVCDQRYTVNDMQRIVELTQSFIRKSYTI